MGRYLSEALAAPLLAALEHGTNGAVYNIGSGVGRSNLDIIDLIRPLAAKSNLQVTVSHEDERKFDVAANVLNFRRLLSCSGWLPKISMKEGLLAMWQSLSNPQT
ncbi:MAG: hypothetical protein RIS97_886 [Pseudomonadota bacterium]